MEEQKLQKSEQREQREEQDQDDQIEIKVKFDPKNEEFIDNPLQLQQQQSDNQKNSGSGGGAQDNIKSRSKGHYIYDFVKIKVNLNEHYYIFSRFLITRMLTLCRIPKQEATKIAKDVKKKIIADQKYEIDHNEMEKILFQFMEINGFADRYVNRYRMASKFFRKRIPLLILIGGAPKVSKSIIATYLAERLNISNVLQTSIVEMMMNTIDVNFFKNKCQLEEEYLEESQLIELYNKTSFTIRKGVHADILKCLTEGKPLIIEGYELLPNLYVQKQNKSEQTDEEMDIQLKEKIQFMEQYIQNKIPIKNMKDLNQYNITNHKEDIFHMIQPESQPGDTEKELSLISNRQKELSNQDQVKPLVVPLQLVLSKRDFKYNVEHSTQIEQIQNQTQREKVVNNKLKNCLSLQNYLLESGKLQTVLPVNIHNLEQTLDQIHDIILDKIEAYFIQYYKEEEK